MLRGYERPETMEAQRSPDVILRRHDELEKRPRVEDGSVKITRRLMVYVPVAKNHPLRFCGFFLFYRFIFVSSSSVFYVLGGMYDPFAVKHFASGPCIGDGRRAGPVF